MKEVSEFIGFLSWRMRNENDLSDITWALCQASEKFANLFLTYIFGKDANNYTQISEFHREYSRGDSRPDMFFKNNETIIYQVSGT